MLADQRSEESFVREEILHRTRTNAGLQRLTWHLVGSTGLVKDSHLASACEGLTLDTPP